MKICQEFYSEYKTHNDLGSIYSTSWGPISTCSNAENKRLDAACVYERSYFQTTTPHDTMELF